MTRIAVRTSLNSSERSHAIWQPGHGGNPQGGFRRDAARIVQTSGLTRRLVACDFEIGHTTLGKRGGWFADQVKVPAQDAELGWPTDPGADGGSLRFPDRWAKRGQRSVSLRCGRVLRPYRPLAAYLHAPERNFAVVGISCAVRCRAAAERGMDRRANGLRRWKK